MDHNNLDVVGDLIAPLSEFLDNFNISTSNSAIPSAKPLANLEDNAPVKSDTQINGDCCSDVNEVETVSHINSDEY